jgi:hypothetical protein
MSGTAGDWIEHLPGNAKWSNAIQIGNGMTSWAAVSLGEWTACWFGLSAPKDTPRKMVEKLNKALKLR